jgi:hypothetical protein
LTYQDEFFVNNPLDVKENYENVFDFVYETPLVAPPSNLGFDTTVT